jgi:ATP-dependent DNA helicase RecG
MQTKLDELRALSSENEWVEFKEAKGAFDPDKLGEYFSALSNEANLKGQPCGWLIFGVKDKLPRDIVGTLYKTDRAALDVMKKHVADHTSQRLTFREIHELQLPQGRVLMFEVPPALPGVPTSWKGHCYGRDGESNGPLNDEERERIRSQVKKDWSAEVVEGASLADLDPVAIARARLEFLKKNPKYVDEAASWDDVTLLNKAKVLIAGKLTHTALLLLGTPESTHHLSPAVAEVSWRLNDAKGEMRDYEHIAPPFLLAGDALLKKIRNLKVRHMPGGTLFPEEVTQYDEQVLREALHNCIAHQDYAQGTRITVVETDDELVFGNRGAFIPVTVEHVIETDAPPDLYRNRFLAQAMVNLNMIDTMGSGIRRMFSVQRARSFPLPDYDLSDPGRVIVHIAGRIIDEKYTRLLLKSTSLSLSDVIALDKVQKNKPLAPAHLADLKKRKLIEGRGSSVFVAAEIAAATDAKTAYMQNRGVDQEHYRGIVEVFLTKFPGSKRAELENALLDKMPGILSVEQRKNRVRNLLQEMRRDGVIHSAGHGKAATWHWTKDNRTPRGVVDS